MDQAARLLAGGCGKCTTEREVRRAQKIANTAPEAKETARVAGLDNNWALDTFAQLGAAYLRSRKRERPDGGAQILSVRSDPRHGVDHVEG